MTAQAEALQHLATTLSEAARLFATEDAEQHAEASAAAATDDAALCAAAARFEDIATKFTIGFRGPPENPEECVPLAGLLEKASAALAGHALVAMSRSCAPLRNRIRAVVHGMLSAAIDLVRWFEAQKTETRNVAPLLAVVWEYAKVLREMRIDDKEATKKEMLVWAEPIHDAIEELKAVEVAEEDDDGGGDDYEDDEELGDDALTEKELEVRPAVVGLGSLALMVLRKAASVVATAEGALPVRQLDELVQLAKRLSEHTDDAVCSVYRPQVRETVRANATRLCDSILRCATVAAELVPGADPRGDIRTLRLISSKATTTLQALP